MVQSAIISNSRKWGNRPVEYPKDLLISSRRGLLSGFFTVLDEKGSLHTPQTWASCPCLISHPASSIIFSFWNLWLLPTECSLLCFYTYIGLLSFGKKKSCLSSWPFYLLYNLKPSSFEKEWFTPISYNLASGPTTIESALLKLMHGFWSIKWNSLS